MRIFYICYEYLHQNRGGVRHVLEVVRNLGRLGHQVDLFAPHVRGFSPNFERVQLWPVRTVNLRIIGWLLFYTLSALSAELIGWCIRPNVIYIREMAYNLWPLFVSRFLRAPLVIEVNGFLLDEVVMAGAGALEQRMIRFFQRITFRGVDRIIAVSEGLKQRIIEEYGIASEKVAVIPNGTDPDVFFPSSIGAARERTGLPKGIPIVGFVGSCYPYHDIDTVIKASPLILKEYPSTRFVIVGDGYMRPAWMESAMRDRVADSFVFTGVVPYEEVPCYMNAFTVCVAPFTRERNEWISLSPMKLYDYMACGRPVVGTALKGVGDLLETYGSGIAVPPEDPEAFADAVLRLISDKPLREKMGHHGREVVLKFYTWERVARDVAEVCRGTWEQRKQGKEMKQGDKEMGGQRDKEMRR